MEAGIVVVARDRVQAQGHVEPGADPFAGIDCAGLECLDDWGGGYCNDVWAHAGKNLGAKTRHPVAQALERVRRRDLARRPAAHLATGVEGEQRLDVELAAERVPQLLTTAVL